MNAKFKDFIILYGIRFIVSLIISLVIFILIYIIKGETYLLSAIDATFIGFIVSFTLGTFSIITNLGFFDIFAYNVIRFINFIKGYKNIKEEYNGTYEYSKSKEFKRKNNRKVFLSYYLASLFFLIPCVILFIIYKINY